MRKLVQVLQAGSCAPHQHLVHLGRWRACLCACQDLCKRGLGLEEVLSEALKRLEPVLAGLPAGEAFSLYGAHELARRAEPAFIGAALPSCISSKLQRIQAGGRGGVLVLQLVSPEQVRCKCLLSAPPC